MTTDALRAFNPRATPQDQPADPRQAPNNAGGYGFVLDHKARARRFLTIGVQGGTYYVKQADLTLDNATSLVELASTSAGARWLVDEAVTISQTGRAPRNNEALFALALVAGTATSPADRRYALDQLPKVARIGTHLFIFARYAQQFRGWGRTLKRAVADWYLNRSVDSLELQVVKYRQREGWSHRDLLRLAHPRTDERARKALFDWITHGIVPPSPVGDAVTDDTEALQAQIDGTSLPLVRAFTEANAEGATPARVAQLVRANPALTWEMLPDAALNDPGVLHALVDGRMPMTALIRQLPRLTRAGLFDDPQVRVQVCAQITDPQALSRARVHPIKLLIALKTYAAGQGRGSAWDPCADVVDALDAAFYASFGNVEPTGKRLMLALDVSGSMTWKADPSTGLTPREVTAAMSLVTKSVDPGSLITAFSRQMVPVSISPRQRLDDVLRTIDLIPMGGTDCSLPMLYAAEHRILIDTFVVYTDNETWAGRIHPHQALTLYREATGIPAQLIVVATESTKFTIAPPGEAGMLDVSGFDSATPDLISAFARGEV